MVKFDTYCSVKGIFRDPVIRSKLFSTHTDFIAHSERTLLYYNLTSMELLQNLNRTVWQIGEGDLCIFGISDTRASEIGEVEKYDLCIPAYLANEYLSMGVKEKGCLCRPKISEYSFHIFDWKIYLTVFLALPIAKTYLAWDTVKFDYRFILRVWESELVKIMSKVSKS